jgi:protein-disulfide isomerase
MTFPFPRAVAVTLAAFAFSLSGAAAQSFNDRQKDEIRALIRDYMLSNPEIIQEAMNELERKQADAEKTARAKALDELAGALADSPRAIVVGNPAGDVTLVEFFDYNCGYCKKAMSDLEALMKSDPKLKVVLRDFPVLGPDSIEASLAAVAAKKQISGDRYWEFHRKLIESRGRIGKDRVFAVAREMGADPAKLQKDMESADVRGTIEETMRFADALRLQGTPAFVVGKEVIFGAVGNEPLKTAIASVRKCGKAVC